MDLYHLKEEAVPTDRTALESVVDYIKEEINRLNAQVGSLSIQTGVPYLFLNISLALAVLSCHQQHLYKQHQVPLAFNNHTCILMTWNPCSYMSSMIVGALAGTRGAIVDSLHLHTTRKM